MHGVKSVGSYFANHKYTSLSYSETDDVAYWMMKHGDINHPAFKHKGASRLVEVIVDNLPAPPADDEKRIL